VRRSWEPPPNRTADRARCPTSARAPHDLSALGDRALASPGLCESRRLVNHTPDARPQRARRGPALERSHLGESERGKRSAVSSLVPMDAGRTSPLLLARRRSDAIVGHGPARTRNRVWLAVPGKLLRRSDSRLSSRPCRLIVSSPCGGEGKDTAGCRRPPIAAVASTRGLGRQRQAPQRGDRAAGGGQGRDATRLAASA
jgi:hypothetical protein